MYSGPIPVTATPQKSVLNNGHWQFPDKMDEKAYAGFIYVIRDRFRQRLYLGKKNYLGKGKLNKGKDSGWRSYVSSSNILKQLLKERPRSEFDFICLEQYKAQGALSYAETWSACKVEVPTTDFWYNTRIEPVSWPVKERITDRHKARLQAVIDWEDMPGG